MRAVRPLISVITPTWLRSGPVLERCLESVKAQTYDRWEHIVISDGPDDNFAPVAAAWQDGRHTFVELADHDPRVRWGVRARLYGIEIAKGDLVAWLDDDNAYRPEHLAALQAHMADLDADWGYSQALFHSQGGEYIVGSAPPVLGQIDTSIMMSSRKAYETATWCDYGQQTIDWDLAERWLSHGLRWAFLPQVTVDYFVHGLEPEARMPNWQITLAGTCEPDQLDALQADIAAAAAPYGLTASQATTDAGHNGPLPAPAKRSRAAKADG